MCNLSQLIIPDSDIRNVTKSAPQTPTTPSIVVTEPLNQSLEQDEKPKIELEVKIQDFKPSKKPPLIKAKR